jgi:hypothetical protein
VSNIIPANIRPDRFIPFSSRFKIKNKKAADAAPFRGADSAAFVAAYNYSFENGKCGAYRRPFMIER